MGGARCNTVGMQQAKSFPPATLKMLNAELNGKCSARAGQIGGAAAGAQQSMTHNECGKKPIYTGHVPICQTGACRSACGGC